MANNSFSNDDSRRLNKFEVSTVFHGIQEDFNMLAVENIKVASIFVDKNTINVLVKMADTISQELISAEEYYSMLDNDETISTNSFVRFLETLESDIAKKIDSFEDVVVFEANNGENISTRKFFKVFIKIIFVLKISILMGESFEDKMDNELLQEEYNRMKREGLI